jgi:hypothetical protein
LEIRTEVTDRSEIEVREREIEVREREIEVT